VNVIADQATQTPRGSDTGLNRLLPHGGRPLSLEQHVALHGPLPYRGHRDAARTLIDEVRAAGLTGRGGAAFPTYRKLEAVSRAPGSAVVVANGAEGEPASYKDRTLLHADPHLTLDGLQLAAEAVGATQAYVYVHRDQRLLRRVEEAVTARRRVGIDRVPVAVVAAPPRFIAGQETAVVHRIEGGPALPRYAPVRVTERGIDGAPTLVQNVETLAHLALIGRFGAAWFRAVGTADEPGSVLTTIHPAESARVVETAAGATLNYLLNLEHTPARAVLVGGYHGCWLPTERAARLPLSNAALRSEGASMGAGVLAALPADRCGLRETARILAYLAAESAGQCGPCLNGLPRIAHALAVLAGPGAHPAQQLAVQRWAGLVERRGACHHPDGSMRLVRSAMTVFEDELRRHEHGFCVATTDRPFLPLPTPSNPPLTDKDWS
jgi:NADH:ubiquinone oxidoreductase subunit F (NADH-binding)